MRAFPQITDEYGVARPDPKDDPVRWAELFPAVHEKPVVRRKDGVDRGAAARFSRHAGRHRRRLGRRRCGRDHAAIAVERPIRRIARSRPPEIIRDSVTLV